MCIFWSLWRVRKVCVNTSAILRAGISCCTYARLNQICTLNGCTVVVCCSKRPPMNGIFTYPLFTYDVMQTQANFFSFQIYLLPFLLHTFLSLHPHICFPSDLFFFNFGRAPRVWRWKKREKIVRRSVYRPVSWLMTHGIHSVSKCYVAFSSILSLRRRHPSAQLHHYYGFNYFVNCGVKKWANVRHITCT